MINDLFVDKYYLNVKSVKKTNAKCNMNFGNSLDKDIPDYLSCVGASIKWSDPTVNIVDTGKETLNRMKPAKSTVKLTSEHFDYIKENKDLSNIELAGILKIKREQVLYIKRRLEGKR